MADSSHPRLGIVANPDKPGKHLLGELIERFEGRGFSLALDSSTARSLDRTDGIPLPDLAAGSDLLVVLGGDGTILWVLRQLKDRVRPIAAINTGTLGFMTCATEDEVAHFVESIATATYRLTDRIVIECIIDLPGREPQICHGLNELTLSRKNESRIIHVEATVDGAFANRYTGDGLIVATPTGSTAYSLSAGGPLVEPSASCFILTPVCPHALANRPMVLDADSRIHLRVPEQRDELSVMVDGELISDIDRGADIRIARAPFVLPLVALPGQSFFGVLHQKLGWKGSTI